VWCDGPATRAGATATACPRPRPPSVQVSP